MASAAAWVATLLLVFIAADALLPFLNLAQRSGMTPGTPEYLGTEVGSMLGFWFALRGLIYRPTYEAVQRKAVRLMREISGQIQHFYAVLQMKLSDRRTREHGLKDPFIGHGV